MPGRVDHDPDVVLRLEGGQRRACGEGPADCLIQVTDGDVQVLGCVLSAISGGPGGPGELASYSKLSVGPSSPAGGRSWAQPSSGGIPGRAGSLAVTGQHSSRA
jgi:hypothetical protein